MSEIMIAVCPLIEIKVNCVTVGLPDGCPLRASVCPLMKPPPQFGSFTDPRDGRVYRTVKIGGQTWLAENLNYNASGSKCYENNHANSAKYGRLYDWNTAMNSCPPGWHLPTNKEWDKLVNFAGGEDFAGNKLKSKNGWNENGNRTDEYGFSALPGGYGISGGGFFDVGSYGYWWSSTEYGSYYAYRRYMGYYYSFVGRYYDYKSYLLSVRCVRDAGEGE
jgi:uncharacterized protein (TIGR02145 family)